MEKKSNNQVTKKQHMVAEVVQKQFSYDGLKTYGVKEIHILDENKKCKRINYDINSFSISNIMWFDSCYELPTYCRTNQNTNLLENRFAEIENVYLDILEKIKNMIEQKYSFKELDNYIKDIALCYFLIFYFRTKMILFYGNSMKGTDKQQDVILKRLNHTLFDYEYITGLINTIKHCYKLSILESPSNSFLLSDSFISTASIDYKGICLETPFYLNRTIGLKNIIILIPISGRYYLLFSDNKNYTKSNYMKIYDHEILKYNSVIYRNSFEFTVGRNMEAVRKVADKVNKYALFGFAGGSVQKPEIWVDEGVDKKVYCVDVEQLKDQGVGFTKYVDKKGSFYTMEKSIQELTNNIGIKLISRNPNFTSNKGDNYVQQI